MDTVFIADFLEENYQLLQNFLEERGVDPGEADVIIDRLRKDK